MSVAPCRPKKNEFAWQVIGSDSIDESTTLGMSCFLFLRKQVKTKSQSAKCVYIYIHEYIYIIIQKGLQSSEGGTNR